MTSRWRSVKAEHQRSRQASGSPSSSGQGEVVGQLAGDGVEVERRVEVVPSEHLKGRQVVAVLGLREVGEGDPAFLALAVVGHEEQVVGGPGLALGLVGRGALGLRETAKSIKRYVSPHFPNGSAVFQPSETRRLTGHRPVLTCRVSTI